MERKWNFLILRFIFLFSHLFKHRTFGWFGYEWPSYIWPGIISKNGFYKKNLTLNDWSILSCHNNANKQSSFLKINAGVVDKICSSRWTDQLCQTSVPRCVYQSFVLRVTDWRQTQPLWFLLHVLSQDRQQCIPGPCSCVTLLSSVLGAAPVFYSAHAISWEAAMQSRVLQLCDPRVLMARILEQLTSSTPNWESWVLSWQLRH